MSEKTDAVKEAVAQKIIASMENAKYGKDSWQKPWSGGTIAENAKTGRRYSGGNLIALWLFGEDYGSGYWATYKQWAELGAQVRKGEKGIRLVKWSIIECRDHGSDEMCDRCGRGYSSAFTVFNAEQVDGWENPDKRVNPEGPIAHAEKFLHSVGAEVRHADEGRAYYTPSRDRITLPRFEMFHSAEAYYATFAHELVHWTGHESRLARKMSARWIDEVFGDNSYAAEELVAELGAAMLCAILGISDEPREDHAKYLTAWIDHLKNDYRLLWDAASKASRAVDYIEAMASASAAEKVGAMEGR